MAAAVDSKDKAIYNLVSLDALLSEVKLFKAKTIVFSSDVAAAPQTVVLVSK